MSNQFPNESGDHQTYVNGDAAGATPTRDEHNQRVDASQPQMSNEELDSYLLDFLSMESQPDGEYVPRGGDDNNIPYRPSEIQSTSQAQISVPTSSSHSRVQPGLWAKPYQKRQNGKDLRLLKNKESSPTRRRQTTPAKPATPKSKVITSAGKDRSLTSLTAANASPVKKTTKRFATRSMTETRSVVFRDSAGPTDADGPSFHRDDDVPAEVHAIFRLTRSIDYEVTANHIARKVNEEHKVHRRGGCIDATALVKLNMDEFSLHVNCKP